MHDRKTYFILPTTDYAPDDLIKLGQIIIDPRVPYRSLSPALQPTPEVRRAYKDAWSLELSKQIEGLVGVYAQAISVITGISGDVAGNFTHDRTQKYEAKKLETEFIEPDDAYVEKSIRVSPIETYLKKNRALGKSVYMITGIRTARTPSLTLATTRGAGFDATVTLDGTSLGVPLQGGPKASISKTVNDTETFQKGSDFVFAYRLRKITVNWRSSISSKEVVGADLWGLDDDSEEDSDSEKEQVNVPAQVDEIESARLERQDFGQMLPERGISKVFGLDEHDDKECLVICPRKITT